MAKFLQYLRDTKGELKHVSWPTRRQSILFTTIVIFVALATAAYLGFFDWLFTTLLEILVI